jgi:hypothetical protein
MFRKIPKLEERRDILQDMVLKAVDNNGNRPGYTLVHTAAGLAVTLQSNGQFLDDVSAYAGLFRFEWYRVSPDGSVTHECNYHEKIGCLFRSLLFCHLLDFNHIMQPCTFHCSLLSALFVPVNDGSAVETKYSTVQCVFKTLFESFKVTKLCAHLQTLDDVGFRIW